MLALKITDPPSLVITETRPIFCSALVLEIIEKADCESLHLRATVTGSSRLAETTSNQFYSLRVGWLVGGAAGRRGSFDLYMKITIWFVFICTLLHRSTSYATILDEQG